MVMGTPLALILWSILFTPSINCITSSSSSEEVVEASLSSSIRLFHHLLLHLSLSLCKLASFPSSSCAHHMWEICFFLMNGFLTHLSWISIVTSLHIASAGIILSSHPCCEEWWRLMHICHVEARGWSSSQCPHLLTLSKNRVELTDN